MASNFGYSLFDPLNAEDDTTEDDQDEIKMDGFFPFLNPSNLQHEHD